jgi:putative transposase
MTRRRCLKRKEQDKQILPQIEQIKSEHPFWGYRRVWARLKFHHGLKINEKRVHRIMKENKLTIQQRAALKATRTIRAKPKAEKPNQFWGIDMTKTWVQGFGWVYIVLVLDWYTKQIVGHFAGGYCRSQEWQQALELGILKKLPVGSLSAGLKLVSDNGCQPSSIAFQKACKLLDVEQIYTSYNNPKGNAETERLMRTMKEECLWLSEWTSFEQLREALNNWINFYNREYPHSALDYRSPDEFENLTKKRAA